MQLIGWDGMHMGTESIICCSEENGAESCEKNLGLSISIQLILLFQHPPRTIAAKVSQSSLPINFKIRIRTYNRNDTDIQVKDRDMVATPVICAPLVRYLAARIWDSISTRLQPNFWISAIGSAAGVVGSCSRSVCRCTLQMFR